MNTSIRNLLTAIVVLLVVAIGVWALFVYVFPDFKFKPSSPDSETMQNKKDAIAYEDEKSLNFSTPQAPREVEVQKATDYTYTVVIDEETNFEYYQGFGVRPGANVQLDIANGLSDTYTITPVNALSLNTSTASSQATTTLSFIVPQSTEKELDIELVHPSDEGKNLTVKLFVGE